MDFLDEILQGSSTTSHPAMISGTHITQEPEEEFDLNALMADINADNKQLQQKQDEETILSQKAAMEADKKAREEALAKIAAQKAEEEKIMREQIQAEEDALAAELEEKQQANPLNKFTTLFGKKNILGSKNKETEKENLQDETKPVQDAPTIFSDTESTEENIKQEKSTPATIDTTFAEEASEPEDTSGSKEKTEKPAEKQGKKQKNQIKKGDKKTPETPKEKPAKKSFLKKTEKPKPETKPNPAKEQPDFEWLATHDSLTQLLNRTAFDLRIASVKPDNLTILFVDINNLKRTNDTFGHEKGNKLIVATASKLAELFPNSVYRIGGDEFIILAEDISKVLIETRIVTLRNFLEKKTANSDDGLIYAVAVGYAIGDGKKTVQELQEEADKAMYEDKAAYKKKHPELNVRQQEPEEEAKIEDYDSLLNKEQQELKEIVRDNHFAADEDRTERIIAEVQSRYQEILAILITDANFDTLYIIRNVNTFLTMIDEMPGVIDYSYFYVIYEGGPQYYGSDDYITEITHIFEDVTKYLQCNHSINQKELAKIPNANIFKNICFDC